MRNVEQSWAAAVEAWRDCSSFFFGIVDASVAALCDVDKAVAEAWNAAWKPVERTEWGWERLCTGLVDAIALLAFFAGDWLFMPKITKYQLQCPSKIKHSL